MQEGEAVNFRRHNAEEANDIVQLYMTVFAASEGDAEGAVIGDLFQVAAVKRIASPDGGIAARGDTGGSFRWARARATWSVCKNINKTEFYCTPLPSRRHVLDTAFWPIFL